MRPDLDDFEEMNENGNEGSSRAMSWVVLSVAVVGFAALAYYAYQSGTQSAGDGQMLVVEADPSPIKEAPADPGGEQFPNKDKTIYDTLSPYRTDEQRVEKLLPEPEEPVIPEPAVGDAEPAQPQAGETTSFVNNESATKAPAEVEAKSDLVPASEEEAAAPAPAPKAEEKPAPTEVSEVPVATTAVPVAEKKPEPVAPAAKPAPAPAPVKKAEPVKPAPAPAATGSYKIQLGAFKSESEARATWGKITAKNGDVVKGSPIIVQADVNGTTYYRLRATGFASPEAAKKACTTLSGRGQACFYAGK